MNDSQILNKTRKQFTLTIESMPSNVPPAARLKRLLKAMSRAYQFRCVEISHKNSEQLDEKT